MFDAMLHAAQQGHVPSQLLFATGAGFSSVMTLDGRNEMLRFREHAPTMAWRAFAAGDSDAAVLLWRAYNRVGRDMLFLVGAIEPDPVKAHALDLLMKDLVPDFIVGSVQEAGLSEDQAQQAAMIHAEWRATAFANAKPPRYGMEFERMWDPEKSAVDLCAPAPQ